MHTHTCIHMHTVWTHAYTGTCTHEFTRHTLRGSWPKCPAPPATPGSCHSVERPCPRGSRAPATHWSPPPGRGRCAWLPASGSSLGGLEYTCACALGASEACALCVSVRILRKHVHREHMYCVARVCLVRKRERWAWYVRRQAWLLHFPHNDTGQRKARSAQRVLCKKHQLTPPAKAPYSLSIWPL